MSHHVQEAIDSLRAAVKDCRDAKLDDHYIEQASLEARGCESAMLVLLWGEPKDGRYGPQFVAAFTVGEVDAMAEMHEERRAEAEAWYRGFDEEEVGCRFFTTWQRVRRPEPGESGR